jgi:hypothetical protein
MLGTAQFAFPLPFGQPRFAQAFDDERVLVLKSWVVVPFHVSPLLDGEAGHYARRAGVAVKGLGRYGELTRTEQIGNKSFPADRIYATVNNPLAMTNEESMDEEKPRKPQTTKFSRSARTKRILERLREGFGYDEIAHEEKLTERRVRQIVMEKLEGREALEKTVHAQMQVERIGQAVRVAGEALSRGEIRAVAPFIKAVETLDRFQSLAREAAPRRPKQTASDEFVRKELVARIRAHVLDECRREAAAEAAAAGPAPDRSQGVDGNPDIVPPPLAAELQPALPSPDPSAGAEIGPAAAAPPLAAALPPAAPHSAPPPSPWGTWAR